MSKRHFKELADPEENWLILSLIKVKLKDGKLLCNWLIHKILAFQCVLILLILILKFFKVFLDDCHY